MQTSALIMTARVPPNSLRALIEAVHASRDLPHGTCIDAITHASRALDALHRNNHLHGAICPENMLIEKDRVSFVDASHPLDNDYLSPERLRGAPPSREDDVYALGASLFELFTGRRTIPAFTWTTRPLHEQVLFDPLTIPYFTIDRLQALYATLYHEPDLRPTAARLAKMPTDFEFVEHDPKLTDTTRFEMGPSVSPTDADWNPRRYSLHVLSAPGNPALEGMLFPLNKREMTVGSGVDRDVRLPEASISREHASLYWNGHGPASRGHWAVLDFRSEYGSYQYGRDRRAEMQWAHGAQIQLGACRVRLVTYQPGSEAHERVKQYIKRYDPVTRAFNVHAFAEVIRLDKRFARWANVQWRAVRFRIQAPESEPPIARSVVEAQFIHYLMFLLDLLAPLMVRTYRLPTGRTGPAELTVLISDITEIEFYKVWDSVWASEHPLRRMPDGYTVEVSFVV